MTIVSEESFITSLNEFELLLTSTIQSLALGSKDEDEDYNNDKNANNENARNDNIVTCFVKILENHPLFQV